MKIVNCIKSAIKNEYISLKKNMCNYRNDEKFENENLNDRKWKGIHMNINYYTEMTLVVNYLLCKKLYVDKTGRGLLYYTFLGFC